MSSTTITFHVPYEAIDETETANKCLVYEIGPKVGDYGYATIQRYEDSYAVRVNLGSVGFVAESPDEPLAAWRIQSVIAGTHLIVVQTRSGRVVLRKWASSSAKDPNRICVVQMRPIYATCYNDQQVPDVTDEDYRIEILGSAAVMASKEAGVSNWEHKVLRELEDRMSGLWMMATTLELAT